MTSLSEKIFVKHISDKVLYAAFIKIHNKKTQLKNRQKTHNQGRIWLANKQMKRCSTPPVIGEMQIKPHRGTTAKLYLHLVESRTTGTLYVTTINFRTLLSPQKETLTP